MPFSKQSRRMSSISSSSIPITENIGKFSLNRSVYYVISSDISKTPLNLFCDLLKHILKNLVKFRQIFFDSG